METLQSKLEEGPVTNDLLNEKEDFKAYNKALEEEEYIWRLKPRSLWLRVGDMDTK